MAHDKVSPRVAADRGDAAGGGRAGRDRARALLGVRARGVHRRHHGRAVQAVRGDDRHRGRAVGNRRAHAHAGALRRAPAPRRHRRRPASSRGSIAPSSGHATAISARSAACSAARAQWLGAFAVVVALVIVLVRVVPGGFLPTEDKGFFAIAVQLPTGASRQRTEAVVAQVREDLLERAGSVAHRGARRDSILLQGGANADQLRDGLRQPQAVGRAQAAGRTARRDPRRRRTARSSRSRTRSPSASTSRRFPGSASPPDSR